LEQDLGEWSYGLGPGWIVLHRKEPSFAPRLRCGEKGSAYADGELIGAEAVRGSVCR
jgi:hypothetical protein